MQDQEPTVHICEDDFAVKDLGDPKKPSHAICEKCKEIKPIAEFKAMSTYAQARSWGYKNKIEIIHKNCKHCRTPLKRAKDLTLKEIQNRIASGDIKGGAIGKLILKNKQDEIARKKREAVEKRWRSERAKLWQSLLTASTPEYTRVRKQRHLTAYNKQDLLGFFTLYHEAIVNVRTFLSLEKRRGDTTPEKNKPWYSYIPRHKHDELLLKWESVPFTERHRLKQPDIFKSKLNQPKENHNESAT